MKIGILSFRPLNKKASVEEIAMQKEIRKKGHTCRIFRSKKFQMIYDKSSPLLVYNGKKFPKYDVVITRPATIKFSSLEVPLIKQMELMGQLLFNQCDPILNCKNKVITMQILDHHGLHIPKTVIVRRPEDLKSAVKKIGGFPIIVKDPYGSFGQGVLIVESMRALKSVLRWSVPLYFFQEFVKYSRGKDIRVFVVNGQIVASMMRSAKKGEFRSNIELGGKGSSVEITEEERDLAIKSVQVLGLHYGGVDLIRGKNHSMILEVNANPGFKALQKASGVNVARTIVDYAIDYAERHKSKTL